MTDSAGPRGLQVELGWAGAGLAGLDCLVLSEVQTEDPPEGGADSRHQDPVARHTAAVTTHQDQVSLETILGEERPVIYSRNPLSLTLNKSLRSWAYSELATVSSGRLGRGGQNGSCMQKYIIKSNGG